MYSIFVPVKQLKLKKMEQNNYQGKLQKALGDLMLNQHRMKS